MGGDGTGTPQRRVLRLGSRFLPKSVHREGGIVCTYGGGGVLYLPFSAEILNRAKIRLREGSQFEFHPSWTAGWTLNGEDLGILGLEKTILGVFEGIAKPSIRLFYSPDPAGTFLTEGASDSVLTTTLLTERATFSRGPHGGRSSR